LVKEKSMSEIEFKYFIYSDLAPRPESPASIGAKFVKTLDALTCIEPTIFANWKVMDLPAIASHPLAAARSRIAALIEHNVSRGDFREPDPDSGYSAVAFTDNVIDARRISLRIHTGGIYKGDTWLETADWKAFPDPAIVTYEIFKKALLAINEIWPPPWACASAFRMDYDSVPLAPGAQLFPSSRFHIPWVGYLSASLITRMVLPPPEIVTERTPDGGLLMIATEDRLDPTNPEHLRRARIIAEWMIAGTGNTSH
jgi:hypothetical protein